MTDTIAPTECLSSLHDRDLVGRFVRDNDADAFAEIVHRHRGTVSSVCRRVLRHTADADDAFQATFLALARRPIQVRRGVCLSSWLYTVAWRISWRIARRRQRQATEPLLIHPSADASAELDRIASAQDCLILDEELHVLPRRYRDVLVLSYFSDRTNQQIADQLSVSKGTVDGLLRRGRNLLRIRLARRGVTMAALAMAASHCTTASAATSPALIESTIQLGTAAGDAAANVPHLRPVLSPEINIMNTSTILTTLLGLASAAGLISVGLTSDDQQANHSQLVAGTLTADDLAGGKTAATVMETVAPQTDKTQTNDTESASLAPPVPDGHPSRVADQAIPTAPYPSHASDREKWMHTLLDQPVPEVDWPEKISLSEVLDTLATHYSERTPDEDGRSHQLTIRPDRETLWRSSIVLDELILRDLKLNHVSLESALQLMFDQLPDKPLDFIIRDDSFLITTREAAENYLEIRLYDVSLAATLIPMDAAERHLQKEALERELHSRRLRTRSFSSGQGFFSVPPDESDKEVLSSSAYRQLYDELYDELQTDLLAHWFNGPFAIDATMKTASVSVLSSMIYEICSDVLWIAIDGEGGSLTTAGYQIVIQHNQRTHRQINAVLTELNRRASQK